MISWKSRLVISVPTLRPKDFVARLSMSAERIVGNLKISLQGPQNPQTSYVTSEKHKYCISYCFATQSLKVFGFQFQFCGWTPARGSDFQVCDDSCYDAEDGALQRHRDPTGQTVTMGIAQFETLHLRCDLRLESMKLTYANRSRSRNNLTADRYT